VGLRLQYTKLDLSFGACSGQLGALRHDTTPATQLLLLTVEWTGSPTCDEGALFAQPSLLVWCVGGVPHHSTRVVELATVVGRGEDGHQLPPCEELVAVLHHLNATQRDVSVTQ
jgi:hypothetical protein